VPRLAATQLQLLSFFLWHILQAAPAQPAKRQHQIVEQTMHSLAFRLACGETFKPAACNLQASGKL
jgi:hypothetical protein